MRLPRLAAAGFALALAGPGAGAEATARPGPPRFGEVRTAVEGCALARTPAEARRHAVRPGVRAPPPTIAAAPGGARVVHRVHHPCLLELETSLWFEGRTAILQERFAGRPGRCRCESRLVSDVGLGPGEWRLEVRLDLDGRLETAGAATLARP